MASYSYDKKHLTRVCADVKKTFLNKLERGDISSVSKNKVYAEIARKLNLKSDRTLWRSTYKYKEYLDDWYSRFVADMESISPSSEKSLLTPLPIVEDPTKFSDEIKDLMTQLQYHRSKINELQNVIKTLRIENESLRMTIMGRFGYIDNLELLNESIGEAEFMEIYNLIIDLYNTRNR